MVPGRPGAGDWEDDDDDIPSVLGGKGVAAEPDDDDDDSPRLTITIPEVPLRCATLAQFSRLYVAHIRAGRLQLTASAAPVGRIVVHVLLPDGTKLEFPGTFDRAAVVHFDAIPPEMHARVTQIVSGGGR